MKLNRTARLARNCFAALFCFATLALAQTETATISGLITDESGRTVPNCEVLLHSIGQGTETTAKTNDAGIYVFASVQPGQYNITVRRDGFKQVDLLGIIVNVQDHTEQNIRMQVGSVSESVTVTAESLVNTTDASVGTIVDQTFVANIPLNGRSLQSLIALAPGAVATPGAGPGLIGEFSVNGQRTESNYYMVDGVSANNGVSSSGGLSYANGGTPAETALGTTQSMVSLDALQEFRMNTSSYSAEYGRGPGAQISLLTRSGTNDWHGALFDYLRNGALDANSWFNNYDGLAKTAEEQNDFGGTVGGPVEIPGLYNGKDKTFFFFSYEGLRLTIPQAAINTSVPDLALRQEAPGALQPLLNAFPIPNGASEGNNMAIFTAAYSLPSSLDAVSMRGDQAFGDKLRIFGRYSQSPSQSQSRSKHSLADLETTTFDARTLTFGATSTLSSQMSNEFRINSTWNNSTELGTLDNIGGAQPLTPDQLFSAPPPAGYQFSLFLNWGGETRLQPFTFKAAQRQFNVTDSFSLVRGAHMLKFGIDFRRLSTDEFGNQLSDAYYFYSPQQIMENSAQYLSIESFGTATPDAVFWNYSSYIQDEWKVTSRLHLSLGLRWDVNPPATNVNGIQAYTLNEISDVNSAVVAPQGTPLYRTYYKGFAPRLGIAYRLHEGGGHDTVIRAGSGIFYDLGNTTAAEGLSGGLGFASSTLLSNMPFPATPAQNALPPASIATPYDAPITAADPNLKLPYTIQWNVAIEQALSASQKLTVTYVGSAGRRLLYTSLLSPTAPAFVNTSVSLIENLGSSSYNALQVQYDRRLSKGLQALASYTWSHSIDDLSDDYDNVEAPMRGDSDFDVRHNFQAALTYDVPGEYSNRVANSLLRHWGLDLRIAGRSGLPLSVNDGYTVLSNGAFLYLTPDLVAGVPVYLNNPSAPGSRVVNINAFTLPPSGQNGTAPRNFLRGFGLWQTDLAMRRDFWLHERLKLQFRAEAFNVFNHANFGTIDKDIADGPALFGIATGTLNNQLGGLNALYQVGGPRSLQLALKLIF